MSLFLLLSGLREASSSRFEFPPGLLFTSAAHHSSQAVTGVLQGPVLGHFRVGPSVLESQ